MIVAPVAEGEVRSNRPPCTTMWPAPLTQAGRLCGKNLAGRLSARTDASVTLLYRQTGC